MNKFIQNSVADLRRILIQSGKYTEEEANNIKGKSNLIDHIMKLDNGQEYAEVFNTAQLDENTKIKETNNGENNKPNYNSLEWHDYVMQQFTKDELVDDKYPTVVGLRRVTEILLGKITKSGPQIIYPASNKNNHRATCIYEIIINNLFSGELSFSASADSCEDNTDHPYSKYPTCIAETRAEARTLRRALKLKVAAAEEMSKEEFGPVGIVTSGIWKETDPISEQQILSIKKKCKDYGIDIQKFINCGDTKYEDITKITRGTAQKMLQRLNEYQSKTSDSVEIPEEIKVSDK